MNQSFDHELLQVVESALGSVRASASRKQAMREELLGHVTEVFDQELARCDDKDIAVAATRRRFGLVDEVGSQLNMSVPLFERWFLVSEKELLMSSKFWLAALFAIAVGPAIILPAAALYRDEGILQMFPFIFGGAILLAGLGMAVYGLVRRFARPA